MAGRARSHLLVAYTVLLCSTAFGAFLTPEDKTLARKAAEKEGRVCKELDPIDIKADEKKDLRKDLVDASGIYEVLMDAMKKSNDSSELSTHFTDGTQGQIGSLLPKAAPIIAFFIFGPVYFLICCWTCCPCCRCCLCRRKERKFWFVAKLIFVIVLGGLIFGMVLAGFLSLRGFGASNAGFKATSCTSAEFVSAVMNGQGTQGQSNYFDGMVRTLERFDRLKSSLKENDFTCNALSQADREDPSKNPGCFITVLKQQLMNTKDIETAVVVATETVGLLATMMGAEENRLPKDGVCNQPTDPGCLHHNCSLCFELTAPLDTMKSQLSSSVSKALQDARKTVEQKLQGNALTSLEASFDDAGKPLQDLTKLIRSSLGPFVEEDSLEKLSDPINQNGAVASVFLILCGLLIAACGGTSVTAWMCLEKRKSAKLRKLTHRCACCTWNSGCIYILFAFLIGGILMIVTMIMSSLCLFMEDIVLTPTLLGDISRAMDLSDLQGPQLTMLQDILGQCFKPNNPTNPLLLNLLKVENSSGSEITMHEMIVGNTKDQINAQFDKIGSTTSVPQLHTHPSLTQMTNMLRDNEMSKMLLPKWLFDQNYAVYTSGFPALDVKARLLAAGLGDYVFSSADRSDATIPGQSQTIKGLDAFVTALNSKGAAYGAPINYPPAQWKQAVADWAARSTDAACKIDPGCDAATNLMNWRHKLISSQNLYKCTYFGSSSACSSRSCKCTVAINSADQFTQSCTQPSGDTVTMSSFTVDCDLAEFTGHVQSFSTTLIDAFKALDAATAATMSGISVNLKGTVNAFILDEITKVSTGLTCGVFGEKYWKFLDGFCYKGVWGMRAMATSYSATAGLTFVVVILIYLVWRIALDNEVVGATTSVEKYDERIVS
eukprot:TRINITY_DN72113_c0_g1_i1.p1 TRINITY_DN72113_c0_g1~~TRINITY_DN72113_c0_g1_i1.p1  ORF type:complete len:890 (-),score=146.84 TRINITY_DN72113_c0_g1_i1:160-2829(-)